MGVLVLWWLVWFESLDYDFDWVLGCVFVGVWVSCLWFWVRFVGFSFVVGFSGCVGCGWVCWCYFGCVVLVVFLFVTGCCSLWVCCCGFVWIEFGCVVYFGGLRVYWFWCRLVIMVGWLLYTVFGCCGYV